jgi:RimJ/RimL family protein N-acetyltransferase
VTNRAWSGRTVMTTTRLVLRAWRPSDLAPFAALNADPEVMEHFPRCLDRAESDALAGRLSTAIAERGFGLWAVEVPDVADFIGFVGLARPSFQAHFTPCIEVGWRLARAHWGHGYASEAAMASLAYGFDRLGFDEIVSFTACANQRSSRVMKRIGMIRSPADDFEHPSLAAGHPLRPHVLYRLTHKAWQGTAQQDMAHQDGGRQSPNPR